MKAWDGYLPTRRIEWQREGAQSELDSLCMITRRPDVAPPADGQDTRGSARTGLSADVRGQEYQHIQRWHDIASLRTPQVVQQKPRGSKQQIPQPPCPPAGGTGRIDGHYASAAFGFFFCAGTGLAAASRWRARNRAAVTLSDSAGDHSRMRRPQSRT